MGEYLSPGVYVEEFESGPRPMSGVSTSIAGFIGCAERGSTEGSPQLVTSMNDYIRKYGGYLSQTDYKENRYLSYAVEQFFNNGGTKCYIKRVKLPTSSAANWSKETPSGKESVLSSISLTEEYEQCSSKMSVEIKKNNVKIQFESTEGVYKILDYDKYKMINGDFVYYEVDGGSKLYLQIATIETDTKVVTFEKGIGSEDISGLLKTGSMYLCNMTMEIAKGSTTIKKHDISLNTKSSIFITEIRELQRYIDVDINLEVLQSFRENYNKEPFFWIQTDNNKDFIKYSFNSQFKIRAKDVGVWGNLIKVCIKKNETRKTQILNVSADDSGYQKCIVKSTEGFSVDDFISNINKSITGKIKTINGNELLVDTKDFAKDNIIINCQFDIEIAYKDINEIFNNVSFNENSSDYIVNRVKKSVLVNCTVEDYSISTQDEPYKWILGDEDKIDISLKEGFDGDNRAGNLTEQLKKAILSFEDNDVVSIMCIPGITDDKVLSSLIGHCEKMKNRFAIIDFQKNLLVSELEEVRNSMDSEYAAMYHPWITMYDSFNKKVDFFPPSGAVAGIYARTDVERGVHKAPANESVKGATGLSYTYTKADQDILNPMGINLIRFFPGQGIRIWGARTISSNTLWKYVNVRRLLIYIEESIKVNTNWIVFEPNDEMLWIRVKRTIEVFLNTTWRSGALAGSTPEEAYYVNVGNSTMTQDDIDNGRLICVIGVAPVKPAEFVIFRVTQKTNEA